MRVLSRKRPRGSSPTPMMGHVFLFNFRKNKILHNVPPRGLFADSRTPRANKYRNYLQIYISSTVRTSLTFPPPSIDNIEEGRVGDGARSRSLSFCCFFCCWIFRRRLMTDEKIATEKLGPRGSGYMTNNNNNNNKKLNQSIGETRMPWTRSSFLKGDVWKELARGLRAHLRSAEPRQLRPGGSAAPSARFLSTAQFVVRRPSKMPNKERKGG